MKNHYKSQLILRRFSDKITTFDIENQTIIENRQIHKIFYGENIYTEEIEKQLAQELERPFAELLDKKLMINSDVISLTRQELFLIKKFLILDSIRMYSDIDFFNYISQHFSHNVENLLSVDSYLKNNIAHLPKVQNLNVSPFDYQMRAMKLFLDCNNINELIEHKLATQELVCWGMLFYDSYLSFWDANDEQDFILSSTNMVSEYEPSHTIFEGLDLVKHSYLFDKLNETNNENEQCCYAKYLGLNQIMYENFDVFNLTSTRCMVMIHPFYRLYNQGETQIVNGENLKVDVPDIWPTCLETREIVRVPKVEYLIQGICTQNDIFTYYPVKLSLFDTLYINSLICSQTSKLIGIKDISRVIDSFECYLFIQAINDREVLENNNIKGLCKMFNNFKNHKFACIFRKYDNVESKYIISPNQFASMYEQYSWNSILNSHVLNYILSEKDKIKSMDNFRFLGEGDERVQKIENLLNEVKKNENRVI